MQPAGGLIVDDHTFMRTAMRECLTQLGVSPIREAVCVSDGRVLAAEATPEIAVLDLMLDDGTSLDLIARLKADGARVIVLSSADDGYSVRSAYAAGASGYLMKSSPTETVMQGLREVRAGGVFADPGVAMLLAEGADSAPSPAAQADAEPLGDRELTILQLVADGLTNSEIAEQLGMAPLSVKGYVARIARKLGAADRSDMVEAARRGNLLL